ncbi:nucleoside-diphosphate sugar epimerase [Glycocaulis albus]|uniref:Nucleoside-diphosphate sugar epimerase n=1 Tax=Glycocaulis albus TaxID=1382801 RepID=A0ABQ1XN46_9PROT|nr:mitochondrial fission ELM1 family protein [Glycocaulis albus]GGG98209.1 nucleoside-diphosphate sugar epimerase [Glycocaulis albus]
MADQTTHAERACFVVTDGRRGMENQALGLAEAVARLTPMRILPVQVPRTGDLPDPGPIAPDLWIGCGMAAVRAASEHRKAFPDAVFVYVQDPKMAAHRFDLVVPPEHDRMRGANVFAITGSPNRITGERLAAAERAFAGQIAALPAPRAAVLIGGDSRHHRFTPEVAGELLARLRRLRGDGIGLMITTSRRTPENFVSALGEAFATDDGVWLHTGGEPNPYFAFLAGADWIFVTEDSTNMLTEAAATGMPVYRLLLDGKPGKFARLYSALEAHGAVRPFLGRLDSWTYRPLHETERAAQRVLEIMARKGDI